MTPPEPLTTPGEARRVYRPPQGDEPLDAIEEAFVRAFVDILVPMIRAELAEKQTSGTDTK